MLCFWQEKSACGRFLKHNVLCTLLQQVNKRGKYAENENEKGGC